MKKHLFICCLSLLFLGNIAFAQDRNSLYPKEALSYLQKAKYVTIVDLSTPHNFERRHLKNAIHIPMSYYDNEQLAEVFKEKISTRYPVLFYCHHGMVAQEAYDVYKKVRPNSKAYYIVGRPPFKEYNEWYEKTHQ